MKKFTSQDRTLPEPASQSRETSPQILARALPSTEEDPEAQGTQFRGMARVFRSLRHRDFSLFWFANFFSNAGTWLQTVALGWLILEMTNSPWLLGINGCVTAAPSLLFSVVGGAIADRLDRRRLMLGMQLSMFLLALLLGTLTWSDRITVASILLIAFLTGLAVAINYPAYQALFPDLVEKKDLLNAVALSSVQFNVARALGPTLAGLALGGLGAAACFYLNAGSFVGLIVVLLVIRPRRYTHVPDTSVWDAVVEGFRFVGQRRIVLLLLSIPAFLSIFGLPFIILMPVFARDLLGVGASGLGYLMGGAGLGAGLSGLTLAYARAPRNPSRPIAASALLFSFAMVGFSLSDSFRLSFALLVVVGFTMVGALALTNTTLQRLTPPHLRGRIMSLYSLAVLGLAPLGSLQAGAVAEWVGPRFALAYGGLLGSIYFAVLLRLLPTVFERAQKEGK